MIKAAMLTAGLLALPIAASAEQFIKDGNYCMSDVCIGDDITTLANIKWNKVTANPIKPNSPVMKNIVSQLAPQPIDIVVDAAPYLLTRHFDQAGIAKLSKVKGFCESHANFEGNFNSENGHPTYITARVEPSADGSTQAIRVYSITRRYPQEYTNEQLAALTQQLTGRYGKVKYAEDSPSWGIGPDRVLFLRGPVDWDGGSKRRNLLKKFPGCGKDLKID